MNYQFWAPSGLTVFCILISLYQIHLMRQQLALQQAPIRKSKSMGVRLPRLKLYWPTLLMIALITTAWLPYVTRPTIPTTSVGFDTPKPLSEVRPGESIFKPGKLYLDIVYTDFGPTPAYDTWFIDSLVILANSVSVSPSTQAALENSAFDEMRRKKQPNMPPSDLNMGDYNYVTENVDLSADDARELISGKEFLYVLGYGEFTDSSGKHHVEYCQFLQAPGDRPVWHKCFSEHRRTG